MRSCRDCTSAKVVRGIYRGFRANFTYDVIPIALFQAHGSSRLPRDWRRPRLRTKAVLFSHRECTGCIPIPAWLLLKPTLCCILAPLARAGALCCVCVCVCVCVPNYTCTSGGLA
eukprot:COSAG02_NODE_17102_length_1028_cov_1.766416_2_plen_114_part_01